MNDVDDLPIINILEISPQILAASQMYQSVDIGHVWTHDHYQTKETSHVIILAYKQQRQD